MRTILPLLAALALLNGPLAFCESLPGFELLPNEPFEFNKSEPAVSAGWSDNHARPAAQPLHFEPNEGQTAPEVKFLTRGRGYTLFLTETEAVMVLADYGVRREAERHAAFSPETTLLRTQEKAASPLRSATALQNAPVLRMRFVDANPSPSISGEQPLRAKMNYFIGNIPEQWHTNISTYGRVQYRELYPGIDLAFYSNQGQLEYDVIVAPGADPNRIAFAVEGADQVGLDENGDLLLTIADQKLLWRKPLVYQNSMEGRKRIDGSYRVYCGGDRGETFVYFALEKFDPDLVLTIDPAIYFATYLGGGGDDIVTGAATDDAGNSYLAGRTSSPNFPTRGSLQPFKGTPSGLDNSDHFVTKLNRRGELLFSTFIGGSSEELVASISVDPITQSVVLASMTISRDYPMANPAQSTFAGGADAVVLKLSPTGDNLVFSTYLGGKDEDYLYGLALTPAGGCVVVGTTYSKNFPLLNSESSNLGANNGSDVGESDAFIAGFGPTGKLEFSTLFGGSGTEQAWGIAVDAEQNLYVAGLTTSEDLPVKNPLAGHEQPGSVAAVNGVVSGRTVGFLCKFAPHAQNLLFSSYFGAPMDNTQQHTGFRRCAVTPSGKWIVSGYSSVDDLATAGAYQTVLGGGINGDVLVLALNAKTPELLWSSYLGGSGTDGARYGLAVDRNENVWIAGQTGSLDFPGITAPDDFTFEYGFVVQLAADGTHALYESSSSAGDGFWVLAVTPEDEVLLATTTTGFASLPLVNALQSSTVGKTDVYVMRFGFRPALQIERSGSTLVVSWSKSADAAYVLESASSVTDPVWSTVPDSPVELNDNEIVTIETGSAAKFFRLRQL